MEPFEFDDEQNENINDIVEKYENSLRENASLFLDPEAFEILADYYELRGELNQAMSVIDQALEQHPFSSLLLIKQAQIYFENKKCPEALAVLDKAEIIDSSESGIYLLRAEIFTFLSKYEAAIEILQQRIKESDEEDLADIYLQMADVYEDWEKYDEVFHCLKNCLTVDPENEEALNRINYCMEITEQYERSRVFHEQLINESPYSVFAWYNLACAFKGMHKFDEAIDSLEYVLAINEDLDFVYQDITELHLRNKNYPKALEVIKDYEQRFDADEDIYLLKGQCHDALLEYKLSRYYYKKALHLNPNIAEAYYRIGESYKAEDNWEQAYIFFMKAAEMEKSDYDYQIVAAEAAQVMKEIEKAIEIAEVAIDISAARFEAYLLMAQIFLQAGDPDTALEILEKGIIFCKSTIELKFAKVGVEYYMGHKQEAMIQLMLLISEAPGKEIFMLYMYPDMENDADISAILTC